MRLLPYGDSALLVELPRGARPSDLLAPAAAVRGVVQVVPGAQTLLIEFDPAEFDPDDVAPALTRAGEETREAPLSSSVEVPVIYDGEDLDRVAVETGLSPAEVIHRHLAASYVVEFCGFAPGFAYLSGLDPALQLPRLREPRTSVPAGSVAVAGEFAGVYPRTSPGGWRLLGRTDLAVWNSDDDPPALLRPGTAVRFVRA